MDLLDRSFLIKETCEEVGRGQPKATAEAMFRGNTAIANEIERVRKELQDQIDLLNAKHEWTKQQLTLAKSSITSLTNRVKALEDKN